MPQESLQLLTSTFQQWLTLLVLALGLAAGVYSLYNFLKENLSVRGSVIGMFGGNDLGRLARFFQNGVQDFWHIRYSCDCSAFIIKGTDILYDFVPCLAHHDKVRQLFYESRLHYPLTQNGEEL